MAALAAPRTIVRPALSGRARTPRGGQLKGCRPLLRRKRLAARPRIRCVAYLPLRGHVDLGRRPIRANHPPYLVNPSGTEATPRGRRLVGTRGAQPHPVTSDRPTPDQPPGEATARLAPRARRYRRRVRGPSRRGVGLGIGRSDHAGTWRGGRSFRSCCCSPSFWLSWSGPS